MLKLKFFVILSGVLAGLSFFIGDAKSADIESKDSVGEVTSAQSAEKRNAISLELLGRGGLYSFDYDRMVTEDIAVGAGISHYSVSMGSADVGATLLPIYGNYYFNKGASHFFATGGADIIFSSGSGGDGVVKGSGVAAVIGAGYEYRGDSGLLFRAAPYLLVGNASGAWLGLSIGYAM